VTLMWMGAMSRPTCPAGVEAAWLAAAGLSGRRVPAAGLAEGQAAVLPAVPGRPAQVGPFIGFSVCSNSCQSTHLNIHMSSMCMHWCFSLKSFNICFAV
jgi:hypothetical protein